MLENRLRRSLILRLTGFDYDISQRHLACKILIHDTNDCCIPHSLVFKNDILELGWCYLVTFEFDQIF